MLLFLPLFVIFVVAAIGWGLFALWISGLARRMPDRLHCLLYASIMGVLICGDLILLAGLIGKLGSGVLGAIFFAGIAAGALALKCIKIDVANIQTQSPRPIHFRILFLLCAPFVLLFFLYDLVPDTSGDAFLYHITVPNYYALEGKIAAVSISFCYNYPLQIEMFYLAAIRFGEEQAGVVMNLFLALVTCVGLYLAGRQLGSPFTGLVAVFLFISMPLTLRWVPTSLVDLSAGTFLIGALVALLHWQRTHEDVWLFLAGISAGGAVAVKLIIVSVSLGIFPLAIAAASLLEKNPHRRISPLKNLLIYASGAILPLLPWMFKNALLIHNPFFPFFLREFPTRPDLIPSALTLHIMHGVPPIGSAYGWAKRARGIMPLLTWGGNWALIFAMTIIPPFFIASLLKRKLRFFWGIQFLLLLFVLHYGSNAQVRWFQGIFAIFLVALAIATTLTIRQHPFLRMPLIYSGIIFFLLLSARMYYLRLSETGLYPWTGLSKKTLMRYIAEQPRFAQAEFLNSNVPPRGKVFLYSGEILSPGRWLKRRFVQAGDRWFDLWTAQNASADTILRDLRRMDVTHLAASELIRNPIFLRLKNRYLKKLACGEGYILYKIVGVNEGEP